jgi:small-conductance mechanosensitive channel
MGPLERFGAFLAGQLGLDPGTITRLTLTLVVLVVYLFVRQVSRKVVARTVEDSLSRYQVTNALSYLFGGLALIALIRVWFQELTGLATYLGLLSAGIAIALQDALTNLAGWVFILTRRPFRVGDRIQIGAHAGDIIDIRIFRFVMLEIGNWVDGDQSTGRVIAVPNGWVFKNSVASYDDGFGYVWNELSVTVTFESDWRKAKEVLTRAVTEHAEKLSEDAKERIAMAADRYHIKFSKLTPVVWTKMTEHGVTLTMRYLCKPRERRSSSSEVWEAVLEAIHPLPDVDFAYPTTRRFDNVIEGKPDARAMPLPHVAHPKD